MTEEPDEFDLPEEDERGPNRRCIASGQVKPAEGMIRFVVSPDGEVVPDLAGKLPGRGIWISAERAAVGLVLAKNQFSKAARRKVTVPADMADRLEHLLTRRCQELLGLARRAGQAIVGFEKVKAELKSAKAKPGAVLLAASDGAADGRDKIKALIKATQAAVPLVEVLTAEELGTAFGRDHAVHVLLLPGRLAEGLRIEALRLSGFRTIEAHEGN